jgi:hypothetical protein
MPFPTPIADIIRQLIPTCVNDTLPQKPKAPTMAMLMKYTFHLGIQHLHRTYNLYQHDTSLQRRLQAFQTGNCLIQQVEQRQNIHLT